MNIPYEAFLIPPDYQVWIKHNPYLELEWEGNSLLLALINTLVARIKHPTKYIKLECR